MPEELPIAKEMQSALGRIRGIVASRVVVDDDQVSQVHVLAEAKRSPKQIVRDVESLCAVQFGVRIDHRKISVAQIESQSSHHQPIQRPQIQSIRLVIEGRIVRVHVAVSLGEQVFEGTAEGIDGQSRRYRTAAAAGLKALEAYLGGSNSLYLDDLASFQVGEWNGLVAGVLKVNARGEELLVGSALVKTEKLDAAVQAVFDAVVSNLGEEGDG